MVAFVSPMVAMLAHLAAETGFGKLGKLESIRDHADPSAEAQDAEARYKQINVRPQI